MTEAAFAQTQSDHTLIGQNINLIKQGPVPKHVAIIPDGNRRWAKKRLTNAFSGHKAGADALMEVIKAGKQIGIEVITVYSFSTENWRRSSSEISHLMDIYDYYLSSNCAEMISQGIKLETIGNLTPLPQFLQQTIAETKMATKNCDQITLILALNYGFRSEMCKAVESIVAEFKQNPCGNIAISENLISKHLESSRWQDPELLIRTSGELRLSNFLLWQLCYAEIIVSPVLWPDFSANNLFESILEFQKRERRWGGP